MVLQLDEALTDIDKVNVCSMTAFRDLGRVIYSEYAGDGLDLKTLNTTKRNKGEVFDVKAPHCTSICLMHSSF